MPVLESVIRSMVYFSLAYPPNGAGRLLLKAWSLPLMSIMDIEPVRSAALALTGSIPIQSRIASNRERGLLKCFFILNPPFTADKKSPLGQRLALSRGVV